MDMHSPANGMAPVLDTSALHILADVALRDASVANESAQAAANNTVPAVENTMPSRWYIPTSYNTPYTPAPTPHLSSLPLSYYQTRADLDTPPPSKYDIAPSPRLRPLRPPQYAVHAPPASGPSLDLDFFFKYQTKGKVYTTEQLVQTMDQVVTQVLDKAKKANKNDIIITAKERYFIFNGAALLVRMMKANPKKMQEELAATTTSPGMAQVFQTLRTPDDAHRFSSEVHKLVREYSENSTLATVASYPISASPAAAPYTPTSVGSSATKVQMDSDMSQPRQQEHDLPKNTMHSADRIAQPCFGNAVRSTNPSPSNEVAHTSTDGKEEHQEKKDNFAIKESLGAYEIFEHRFLHDIVADKHTEQSATLWSVWKNMSAGEQAPYHAHYAEFKVRREKQMAMKIDDTDIHRAEDEQWTKDWWDRATRIPTCRSVERARLFALRLAEWETAQEMKRMDLDSDLDAHH
ncbi:hypothetical protein P280DRAFT_549546 [Massarina eburnea CBS 473.64]|uniref:Uncharacterized protein n=1 Tax=Massarina eburnea CBS 473.64 TaxID=1395130 RepID=A0A6A6S226_9PLEO|nr:hypothetical protein P280DRAFT_549546 [Massarina eburnea CBS 473.64]